MSSRISRMCRGGLALASAMTLVSYLAVGLLAGQGRVKPVVVPPEAAEEFVGTTYDELSAAWWQWAFGLPVEDHPLFDRTGADAAAGQSGNVWFLGGVWWPNDGTPPPGPVTRKITVPEGTALFFPIVNGENNAFEVGDPDVDPAVLAEGLAEWVESISNHEMYAKVDGKPVKDIVAHRATASGFSMTLPDGNALQAWGYDFDGGVIDDVVADGYFLLVAPLSPGKHKIAFGVKHFDWSMDIDYVIEVVPTAE